MKNVKCMCCTSLVRVTSGGLYHSIPFCIYSSTLISKTLSLSGEGAEILLCCGGLLCVECQIILHNNTFPSPHESTLCPCCNSERITNDSPHYFKLLTKHAEFGLSYAEYYLGVYYNERDDIRSAGFWFERYIYVYICVCVHDIYIYIYIYIYYIHIHIII